MTSKTWWMGRSALLMAVASALPAPTAAQTVLGTVFDSRTGDPLPIARVSLEDIEGREVDATLATGSGLFRLTAPSEGAYVLVGSTIGGTPYRQGPIVLAPAQEVSVEFVLPSAVMELTGLTVEVERRVQKLEMNGFYDRALIGSGIHIDAVDLDRRTSNSVGDILRMVPGVRLPNSSVPGRSYILFSAAERAVLYNAPGTVCAPRIILDGYVVQQGGPTPFDFLVDVDGLLNAQTLAGIEVYRRPSEVPTQYGGTQSLCGVLVIWSVQGA